MGPVAGLAQLVKAMCCVPGQACLQPASAFLFCLVNHGSWGEGGWEAGGKDKTTLP